MTDMWCLHCEQPIHTDDEGNWVDWRGADVCFDDNGKTTHHEPRIGNEK